MAAHDQVLELCRLANSSYTFLPPVLGSYKSSCNTWIGMGEYMGSVAARRTRGCGHELL